MPALASKARVCFFYFLTNLLIFVFCYISAAPAGLAPVPPAQPAAPQPQEPPVEEDAPALLPAPLRRPFSSSGSALVFSPPAQVALTVEYLVGQPHTAALTASEDVAAFTKALQNAAPLPQDAQLLAATPANAVSAQLYYPDGYGRLYLFNGCVNGSKRPVTVIQDSDGRLYEAKANISQEIFQKAQPQLAALPADKVNIYTATHFRRLSLQAQLSSQEDFSLLRKALNTLTHAGGASHLDQPDLILSYVPSGSAQEVDMWYLWTNGKKLTLVSAQNPNAAYTSQVTSREFKKLVDEFSVK